MKALATILTVLTTSTLAAQGSHYFKIGEGCPGPLGTPTLTAEARAVPILGRTFSTELNNVPDGSAIGILGLSTNNWGPLVLPIELDAFMMPECWLFTDLRRARPLSIVGGKATWDFQMPTAADWIGQSFYQQVIVLDADQLGAGATISNAMEGVINAPQPAPFVDIEFPPPLSLTDRDSILVRGHAYDPDGVAEVLVNGHLATSSDDFANWQLRVPLTNGSNELVVETMDKLGSLDPRAGVRLIESQSVLLHPSDIAIDRSRNLALITDSSTKSLSAMDLSTGKLRLVSDVQRGTGEDLNFPLCVAFDGERALVGDRAIIAVDLISGDRSILSSDSRGSGPSIVYPVDIVVAGGRALVIDQAPSRILTVDLLTGDRQILSGPSHGAGPLPLRFDCIALAPDPNQALVAGNIAFLGAIFTVDLTTGDRTVLSDPNTGAGPDFFSIVSLALDLPRNRVLALDLSEAVYAVDLDTGDRSILSDEDHGNGPLLIEDPNGIVVDGARALVIAEEPQGNTERDIPGRVVEIDLLTGDRSDLDDPRAGIGNRLNGPWSPAMTGTEVHVIELDWNAIYTINRATGIRKVLSRQGTGGGILLSQLRSVASQRDLTLASWSGSAPGYPRYSGALLSVDQTTGDREVFTGLGVGEGPEFNRPGVMTLSRERDLALVIEPSSYWTDGAAIFSVELSTRNRRLVTRNDHGGGPGIGTPYAVALYKDSALVLDSGHAGILKVDLLTGDRSILSNPTHGLGPIWSYPSGIAVHENRILIGGGIANQIFAVDPVTGDRTIAYDSTTGTGPVLLGIGGISVQGDLAAIPYARGNAVFLFDLITGERVIMAR